MLAKWKKYAIIVNVRQISIKMVHFSRVSPRPCSTPKIVLHLPPPRVNSDNVITSCVLIKAITLSLLTLFVCRLKEVTGEIR